MEASLGSRRRMTFFFGIMLLRFRITRFPTNRKRSKKTDKEVAITSANVFIESDPEMILRCTGRIIRLNYVLSGPSGWYVHYNLWDSSQDPESSPPIDELTVEVREG